MTSTIWHWHVTPSSSRIWHLQAWDNNRIHTVAASRAYHSVRVKSSCVLLCVAVCCSVLQCVAVCCNVMRCGGVCCSAHQKLYMQCVAVCCSVLQCVPVCISVLQSVAVSLSAHQKLPHILQVCNIPNWCETLSTRENTKYWATLIPVNMTKLEGWLSRWRQWAPPNSCMMLCTMEKQICSKSDTCKHAKARVMPSSVTTMSTSKLMHDVMHYGKKKM